MAVDGSWDGASAVVETIEVTESGMLPDVPQHGDSLPHGEEPAVTGSGGGADGTTDVEALSMPRLARLFGVPLLIIGAIVGGAVLVVALFGAPASPQQHSVDTLLQALEMGTGEARMGILSPRNKELWQKGLELTVRLERRESEFSQAQLRTIALRLGAAVTREFGELKPEGWPERDLSKRRAEYSKRLEFLIRSLGLTGQPEAVGPLVEIVRNRHEDYAVVAMEQLGNLRDLPNTIEGIDPILDLLTASQRADVRLVACTTLSVLATPGQWRVLEGLADIMRVAEGEVAWSAALALARLGSAAGKSTLLDLLDRSFWETGERYRVMDGHGNIKRYAMPGVRIEELLMAALDAASHLDDPELWLGIERLRSDPSPVVRRKAETIFEAHSLESAS